MVFMVSQSRFFDAAPIRGLIRRTVWYQHPASLSPPISPRTIPYVDISHIKFINPERAHSQTPPLDADAPVRSFPYSRRRTTLVS